MRRLRFSLLLLVAFAVISSRPLAAAEPGQLDGDVPSGGGVGLAAWGGGSIVQLEGAAAERGCNLESLWVTADGRWVAYNPDVPEFVNGSFLELHPGGEVPAKPVLLVCRSPRADISPVAFEPAFAGRIFDQPVELVAYPGDDRFLVAQRGGEVLLLDGSAERSFLDLAVRTGGTEEGLLRSGQLSEALAFIRANNVAYVTIDIGANDLLGHLDSDDCSEDIATPACQDRLGPALQAYRANLDRILRDVRDAAGAGTPILFLQTYNPFSLGLGGLSLEAASDDATDQLNTVAAEVAAEHAVTVADGARPMRGTTGATTHMLGNPPDIHPNGIGYDLLAQALAEVLP